jgi:transposase-like protein
MKLASKGQKFRKWSKEEKLEIVKKYLEEHVSLIQLSKEVGATASMIAKWAKKYIEEGEEGLSSHRSKRGNPYAALHTSKNLNEVDRLRLIIAKQEVEIERLKKGYWVKGVGAEKEYITGNDATLKSSKHLK